MSVPVAVKRLAHADDLPLPDYATSGAAGFDLQAANHEPITIAPLARALIPTGLAIALPADHELQIRPRSGLALKHGIMIANSPGTVDADYRGEIRIILLNAGEAGFTVTRGMRIAQGVVAPVSRVIWQETDDLDRTARGIGGFGSTGLDRSAEG